MSLKISVTNLNDIFCLIYSDTEALTGEKADTETLLEKSQEFPTQSKWLTVNTGISFILC